MSESQPDVIARHWPWMFGKFSWYSRRLVRKRFNAVRVLNGFQPSLVQDGGEVGEGDSPAVVCLNHPAWWDPMAAVVAACEWFGTRTHFAPIDEEMLGQYPVLDRLGFFGVQRGTPRGGVRFLKTATRVLEDPSRMLWITGQGTFTDVRDRPVELMPGVQRLAHTLRRKRQPVTFCVMAVEYVFWDESKPEMLLAFGGPMTAEQVAEDGVMAEELQRVMDALAAAARARDPEAFSLVDGGSAGVGGAYDGLRRLRAWLSGRRFRARHGG